jgi:hypothetical protein
MPTFYAIGFCRRVRQNAVRRKRFDHDASRKSGFAKLGQ